jgi:hypothetical protein
VKLLGSRTAAGKKSAMNRRVANEGSTAVEMAEEIGEELGALASPLDNRTNIIKSRPQVSSGLSVR